MKVKTQSRDASWPAAGQDNVAPPFTSSIKSLEVLPNSKYRRLSTSKTWQSTTMDSRYLTPYLRPLGTLIPGTNIQLPIRPVNPMNSAATLDMTQDMENDKQLADTDEHVSKKQRIDTGAPSEAKVESCWLLSSYTTKFS